MRCLSCEVLVTRIGYDKFKCPSCGGRYERDDKGRFRTLDENVTPFSCLFPVLTFAVVFCILYLRYKRIIP